MFRLNTTGLKEVSQSVTSAKDRYGSQFDSARKQNISTLEGQNGCWAAQAENSYTLVDVQMTSFRAAYEIFATDLAQAATDAVDSVQAKYKALFSAIGTDPQDETKIKCNPDSNFGNVMGDAATAADSFTTEASDLSGQAAGLDNEQGERDEVIAALDNIQRYTKAQADSYRSIQDSWTALSSAVRDFDGQYSSKFSGDFVTAEQTQQARQDVARAILGSLMLSSEGSTSGSTDSNYTDVSTKGSVSIDENGKISMDGEAEAAYHLWNAQGNASASLNLLGINSSADASGEIDISAGAKAKGSISNMGASGEVSVHAGIKASGDASINVGNNLPFGGVGVSAHGEGEVGADAAASGQFGYNPDDNSVGVGAHAEAFAGAKAEGNVSGRIGPLSITGDASVRAGAGADADAGINFKDGKLNVNLGASGTVGIGAGAHVSASLDIGSVADEATNFIGSFFH